MKRIIKGLLVIALFLFLIKVNALTGKGNRSFNSVSYNVVVNAGGCDYYVLDSDLGYDSVLTKGGTVKEGEKLTINNEMFDEVYKEYKTYLRYKNEGTKEYYVLLDDVKLDGKVKEVPFPTTDATNDILVIGDVKLYSIPSVFADTKGTIEAGTKISVNKIQTDGNWYHINDGKNVGWFLAIENKDSLLYYLSSDSGESFFNEYDKVKVYSDTTIKAADKEVVIPKNTVFNNWFRKDYVTENSIYVVYNGYLGKVNKYAQRMNVEGTTDKELDILDSNGYKVGTLPSGTAYKSNYMVEDGVLINYLYEVEYNGTTGWVRLGSEVNVEEATGDLAGDVISFAFNSSYDISGVKKATTEETTEPTTEPKPSDAVTEPVKEVNFIEKYKGLIAACVALLLFVILICAIISRKKRQQI